MMMPKFARGAVFRSRLMEIEVAVFGAKGAESVQGRAWMFRIPTPRGRSTFVEPQASMGGLVYTSTPSKKAVRVPLPPDTAVGFPAVEFAMSSAGCPFTGGSGIRDALENTRVYGPPFPVFEQSLVTPKSN